MYLGVSNKDGATAKAKKQRFLNRPAWDFPKETVQIQRSTSRDCATKISTRDGAYASEETAEIVQ